MSNADDLLKFSSTEESEVEEQVKALAESGVNVVVAAGKFGDLYLHFLNKYKIMGVRLTSKFDLRRLCRTIGAQAQARIVSIMYIIHLIELYDLVLSSRRGVRCMRPGVHRGDR